jgi:hypothetical protein
MGARHTTILGVLIGVIIILVALRLLGAAFRETGRGDCLTGCCLFELGNSLIDLGCGLIGCGGALAILLIPIVHWAVSLHR